LDPTVVDLESRCFEIKFWDDLVDGLVGVLG